MSSDDDIRIACPVCGSANDRDFRKVDGYRIAQCADCGFLFVNPRPAPPKLAELYRARETNPFFSEGYEPPELEAPVLDKVFRTIRKHVRGGQMLEIGCGRGDLLKLAQSRGFSPTGCDFFDGKPPVVPGVRFFDGPLGDAKFADGAFDIVVIRNVLEHLFDPRDELAEAHRVLKPGGFLYAKVPNAQVGEGPFYRKYVAPPYPFAPPYHLSHFSARSMTRLLKSTGFDVVDWNVEQPTIVRSTRKNLIRQAAYRGLSLMKVLSGGRFPQITLACIARRA
ncbi:MAG TPA: class I SAM-dependent methyltransferase [Rhizomicrobium sp.]|jgi:SAM-dependent methyltransferase|nr:class I SAM-dependent methyltransferase [Rhizomicrobium sp.]